MEFGMEKELLRQIPLFESLSNEARDFILNRLKTETFAAGEVIVRQGDTGNSLYIVTHGLVKVTKREKDGTSRELARFRPGDYFGEMSLLAEQPRSADITSITDTTTLIFFKQDMDDILQAYPSVALHFSKILSKRLRDVSQLNLTPQRKIALIAVYGRAIDPLLQAVLVVNLAASFTKELRKRVLLLDLGSAETYREPIFQMNADVLPPRSQAMPSNVLNEVDLARFIKTHSTGFHILPLAREFLRQPQLCEKDITPLIRKLERDYDYILINCAQETKKITQTAIERADVLLYLTPATDEAIQHCQKDVNLFIQGRETQTELLIGVVQQEHQTIPARVLEETLAPHQFLSIFEQTDLIEQFLRKGHPFVYEHPKSRIARSLQRVTRKIGKVQIGLALGSGAARGFAHVGVLKVLEAHDIPIDMITGCSMGAFVGGFYAAGVTVQELEEMVLNYRNRRRVRRTIFDVTLPLYGFSKGNRLARFMRHSLGEMTFDDVQIPFAAVATDISNGNEIVLRNGVLWQALRASGSVPVLFEPYKLEGRYLIDGSITNPLPTDILVERNLDIILASSVTAVKAVLKRPSSEAIGTAPEPPRASFLSFLSRKRNYTIIDALTRSLGIMSAANTLQKSRLADVDIRPNVAEIDWGDFHRGDELIAAGEQAAEEAIPSILALLHKKD